MSIFIPVLHHKLITKIIGLKIDRIGYISKDKKVKIIKECVSSRKDKNFLIIARTDANSVEGLEKTLDRIKAYEEAGADMIFPEAMKDENEFEKVRSFVLFRCL